MICVFGIIVLLFFCTLFKIQIIDAPLYAKAGSISSRLSVIPASRGEILDRNGNPLVTNRQGNSVVFDATAFPTSDSERNALIYSLIQLFEINKEEWTDNLPILCGAGGKYVFEEDREYDISVMKGRDLLDLNEYATAQNCMDALIDMFDLGEYNPVDARKIASVRYEMKRLAFSVSYPYTFAEDVSTKLVAKIKENSAYYKGVTAQIVSYREYADGTIAPHVLGVVGAISAEEYAARKDEGYGMNDMIGKSGLESAEEEYLKGKDGVRQISTNADGTRKSSILEPPKQGNTIITTIDAHLQKVVQDSLADTLNSISKPIPSAGAAVVLKVNTGEVLACATYPSYDNATYTEDYDKLAKNRDGLPLFNRALLSTYEPGSTIKMSVALAALEEGVIDEDTRVYCSGTYRYLEQDFKCEQAHSTSYQSVVTALCESCNSFFYDCGKNLGYAKINEYRTMLGLAQKTGIELGESIGVMDSPEYRASLNQPWYAGYNIQTAIGQGNLFTPIQLANYCAIIANGGTRYRLHFIKSIKSYDYTETVLENVPEVLGKAGFLEKNLDLVRLGMYRFCTVGYGTKYFYDLPVNVAGKTGTSQAVWTGSDGRSLRVNNAFFVSFAPYEDPEIALCLVGEGVSTSTSLLPIATDIYNYYFTTDGVVGNAPAENELIG
ncbi:MAG: hypothetical protein IJT44_08570 [Clostridia bacterium]|nr:hypothetical protein [Clostridia bacterium]